MTQMEREAEKQSILLWDSAVTSTMRPLWKGIECPKQDRKEEEEAK